MSDRSDLNEIYSEKPFSGRSQSLDQFEQAAVALLSDKPGLRLLDLGCGAGDLVFALKRRRPDLQVTGIDISAVNIEAAMRRAAVDGVNFETSDYYARRDVPFDVIIAESVLHLLGGSDKDLASKLASDLRPGGLLIATMPQHCSMNAALLMQRRIWKAMPRAADALAVVAGRLVYRNEPRHIIEERVHYLRVVPERLHGPAFAAQMKSSGLDLLKDDHWPKASMFKLNHRLLVFRREG